MAANSHPTVPQEVHNQRLLEREIRSMISTLTGHLTKSSGQAVGGAGGEEGAGGGMRVVTLAGTNKGAMMEGRVDMDDSHGVIYGDDGQLSAFANSNYQAVNNSIILGGSCTAEDPGVHLVITEYEYDNHDDGAHKENPVKKDSDYVEKMGQEAETIKNEQSTVENGLNKQGVARS